jgi:hypothetical protein
VKLTLYLKVWSRRNETSRFARAVTVRLIRLHPVNHVLILMSPMLQHHLQSRGNKES